MELHSGIKFSIKIEYTNVLQDFLKCKLRSLRINNFKEEFDIDNDSFAKKDSL